MFNRRVILLACAILLGLGGSLALFRLAGIQFSRAAGQSERVQSGELGDYVILAWNDLGMHCMNRDFADLAVLPPYNTLWAQVIRRGHPPQIVTTGITVTYVFTDNTYSVGKTNFWSYEDALFGVSLPDNVGLAGKGLAGEMEPRGDHFVAEGIPLTEFSDSAPAVSQPLQIASITAYVATSGDLLAQTQAVAPVSSEMDCGECHCDGPDCLATYGQIEPTGKVETNILTLHDQEHLTEYPPGVGLLMENRPVLCASCHASNALGTAGEPGIPNLSEAMHDEHQEYGPIPGLVGCYYCHPGQATRCLRDVMSEEYDMWCTDCHGDMATVANNPNPWLNEPRCDNPACHGDTAGQDHPLYRFSTAHGGVYCEGCHDSTHAIAPSREYRDGIKFTLLQGSPGPLEECSVCHFDPQPDGEFTHEISYRLYLPLTIFR